MKSKTLILIAIVGLMPLAFISRVDAVEELVGHVGNYQLAEHHCPGGIASSINVGIYDGIGVVKTSQGYLFSINMAGGSVMIKNGPTTICTGSIAGDKFSGSCMDNNRNFCAVVYQKAP